MTASRRTRPAGVVPLPPSVADGKTRPAAASTWQLGELLEEPAGYPAIMSGPSICKESRAHPGTFWNRLGLLPSRLVLSRVTQSTAEVITPGDPSPHLCKAAVPPGRLPLRVRAHPRRSRRDHEHSHCRSSLVILAMHAGARGQQPADCAPRRPGGAPPPRAHGAARLSTAGISGTLASALLFQELR